MGVLQQILQQISRSRPASMGVGGLLGGAVGGILNEEDPLAGATGGALTGVTLGMLGGGRRVIPQLVAEGSHFSGQANRWGQRIEGAPSTIGLADSVHAGLVDERSPWYFGDPEVERNASNLIHGGMSEAILQRHDLMQELEKIKEAQLLEEARTWLGGSTVPRAWDTVRMHQKEALDEAARTYGTPAYAAAKARYDEITEKLNNRNVATEGMDEAAFQAERAAQASRLTPEQMAQVQGFGTKFQDALWNITSARHRMGDFDPAEFAKWEDQRARGIPFFPSYKNNLQQSPEGHLIQQMTEKAGFARSRGLSVPGLDELQSFMALEGSTLPLDDPLASGFHYLDESLRQAKRNQATKTLIDGAYARGPVRSDGTPFIREMQPGEVLKPGEGAVSFVEQGQSRNFAVPVEWSDLLHGADAREISMGLQIMGKVQRINSAMITGMNVGFMAGNILRDVQAAWILTRQDPKNLPKFIDYWRKAAAASFKGDYSDPMTREAFSEGAMGANLSRQLQWEPEWMSAAGLTEPGVLNTITSRLRNITNATEEATKIASYKLMREGGQLPAEAAFNTRRYAGSPDFARQGSLAPQARPLLQFWNPQIQGIARNVERARQDPAYMASWMGALATGYLALESWNSQQINPESGRPWIEDVPEWERASNIIIVLPGKGVTYSNGVTKPNAIKIPLDHLARLLLSPFRSLSQNLHGDPAAPTFTQSLSNIGSQFLPLNAPIDVDDPARSALLQLGASTNPLLRIPLEQGLDRQAFSDSPIVGQRLGALEATEQFTESTSPTAKRIAQMLGVSPARTEHVLRGVLPGLGTQAIDAVDMRSRVAMPPEEIVTRLPLVGGVMSRFMLGRGSAERDRLSEDLYAAAGDADKVTRTGNEMELRDPEAADRYLESNLQKLEVGPGARRLIKALSGLRREREAILRDTTLSPQERASLIQELEAEKMEILRTSQEMLAESRAPVR